MMYKLAVKENLDKKFTKLKKNISAYWLLD
jgi:hypothetical protein